MRLTEYLYPTEKTAKQPAIADSADPAVPVTQPVDEVQTTQQPVEQVPPQDEVPQEKNVPSVSDRVSSEGYYNVLKNWNRPNFDDEEKRLRRNRSAALIGDMANIFAQGMALSRGARAFSPMQSQTAKANERIQSLQDMKRNENIDYQNKVLSSQYKDFELKRAEDQLKQKQSLDKYKLDIQNGQFGEEMKYKYDALQEQVRNHKISQEHADKVLMETARHNKKSESTAGYNAQSQRMSAQAAQQNAATNASKGNSSTGMDSITLTGSDGKRTTVDYPKSKNGALLSLYNRMKEESEKNPQKYGTLDDINMKMGEGGDQATKIISIVKRRIADFPQLTGEFNQLVGGGAPTPKAAKSASLLPNNNKPSLLP